MKTWWPPPTRRWPRPSLASSASRPADIPAHGRGLPEVNVVSAPGAEKWRAEADALATVAPILAPVMRPPRL
jgi:hypothetical protein